MAIKVYFKNSYNRILVAEYSCFTETWAIENIGYQLSFNQDFTKIMLDNDTESTYEIMKIENYIAKFSDVYTKSKYKRITAYELTSSGLHICTKGNSNTWLEFINNKWLVIDKPPYEKERIIGEIQDVIYEQNMHELNNIGVLL